MAAKIIPFLLLSMLGHLALISESFGYLILNGTPILESGLRLGVWLTFGRTVGATSASFQIIGANLLIQRSQVFLSLLLLFGFSDLSYLDFSFLFLHQD